MNEEKLRQEIAALRAEIDEVDNWASGLLMALVEVLPALLRGHPQAGQVADLLQADAERFEELRKQSRKRRDGETAALYEPRKMLYHLLAIQGVWPNVTAQQAAQNSIRRTNDWHQPR
ncbi:hypothetical protein [Brachymonas chironomi]|uniref:hypothetical protein n=1 Tax=Brachymonas chironomi TaxID=491919 RepID=UPI0012EA3FB5|nr:hypothetical protein [Brachymonas chironomi]